MSHSDNQSLFRRSLKSDVSDELINTCVIRPVAGLLVRGLYLTPITPNQITVGAAVFGIVAAYLYTFNDSLLTALAGISISMKDLLDSVDGQLARAKTAFSRAGRFLDSIGDFAVNLLVFAAIAWTLVEATQQFHLAIVGVLSFLGTTLRVSYHVFYQTSCLHLRKEYSLNRTNEEFRPEDRSSEPYVQRLQAIYLRLYGWQDRLMEQLDSWCRDGIKTQATTDEAWYGDRLGLRLSGFQGMGTELFVLTVFSLANALQMYLYLNVLILNLIWVGSIFYRRMVLRSQLLRSGG